MSITRKKIAILGSTGSIGTQALEVIGRNSGQFKLEAIAAGHNAELLINQVFQYNPKFAVIADTSKYGQIKEALQDHPVTLLAGPDAIADLVTHPEIDIVLTAIVGFAGLIPTLSAIRAGKNIALANKETLVVAGELITKLIHHHGSEIIPVDSEHSAIFQCLTGEDLSSVSRIILTASGGPFRGMSSSQLQGVTKHDALRHPNWCMGNKITIDSATLMNKGLEAIEARWLFNLDPQQIEVIIHPQSVIHSLVVFKDGSIKAQLGVPDMRLPIQYALSWPSRLVTSFTNFSFADYPQLTFEKPDTSVFRNLDLAYHAMRTGGNMPCIMNAANEAAVEAFLNEELAFHRIPDVIAETMQKISFIMHPTLEDLIETDAESRKFARHCINS